MAGIRNQDIVRRRERALRIRLRKRKLEGGVYRRLWGRELPDRYLEIDVQRIRRVLILQRNQRIGDLVVGMAITGGLRQALPDADIAMLVPKHLVELAGVDHAVDQVIPQRSALDSMLGFVSDLRMIRGDQWDLVVVLGIQARSMLLARLSGARWQLGYSYNHRGDNLNRALVPHHSCNRSGWEYPLGGVPHIVDFWAELCRQGGVPITPSSWEHLTFPDVPDLVREIFGIECGGLKIGLHPFSGNPIRYWMLGRWAVLGRELIGEYGAQLVITGGAADEEGAEWLKGAIGEGCEVAAGRVSLVDTWSALRELDLVISVDTGMIHMAAAVGVPVISLFGPGDPAIWGPRGQLDRVIQRFPECQRCKGGRCVQPRIYCMEAISVDDVMVMVSDVVQNNSDVMINMEYGAG